MIGLKDIKAARERIGRFIHETPLERSAELDTKGAHLYSKLEILQETGSFKIRGALNKLLSLPPASREKGVIAASMGNHAQGVALAGKRLEIPVVIVMPQGAPIVKLENTRAYGAEVLEVGSSFEDSLQHAQALSKERGLCFIPAFDDEAVIEGQGTIALEILEKLPDVDEIVVPVGGGGLIAGVAIAAKESRPKIKITGVQAAGANGAVLSFQEKRITKVANPTTFADGIRVAEPGRLCFDYIQKYVDRMVSVDEDSIASAVLTLMETSKAVVEGAGATTLAAVEKGLAGSPDGKTVLILSGGNIDFTQITRILWRGLRERGRVARIQVLLPDKPGMLAGLVNIIKEAGANILDIEHDRAFHRGPVNTTAVRVTFESRGSHHTKDILSKFQALGYQPEEA